MKRNFFAVSFVLIVLVLAFVSCKLGVSVSTSGQSTSTGQRTEEQMEPETEPQLKPDKLSGVFTVNSSEKKVQFSKGALYWDGSSFKMEENQYDYRTWKNAPSVINGEYNANNTDIADGATGLFYWSKDVEKTYVLNYDSTGRTNSDTFAFAKGGTGAIEGWDVLSKEEWEYLINRIDSNDNCKWGFATITTEQGASVKGLVLLPDSWTLPDGYNWEAGDWTVNNYNAEQWAMMEQAGAVFLPMTGRRGGSTVSNVGREGRWLASSSDASDYAHALNLSSGNLGSGNVSVGSYGCDYGRGVRLVAVVKN